MKTNNQEFKGKGSFEDAWKQMEEDIERARKNVLKRVIKNKMKRTQAYVKISLKINTRMEGNVSGPVISTEMLENAEEAEFKIIKPGS